VKSLALVILLAGLVVGCNSSNTAASADVVARVDGKDITVAQLEKQFQARITGAEQPPSPDEAQDLKLQLLSEMINDQIFLELASKQQLTATDAEVDVKFNEFKSQYTEEAFKQTLDQQKMSVDDIKAELRKSITLEKLVNKEITSKITVSDAEIKDFYEKNKASFNLPEAFHVAHILVTPVPEPAQVNAKNDDAKNEDEARQKALRLLKDIQGGADFAAVAKDYSEDVQSSPNGGDLDFQPLDALTNIDPALAQGVQRLKVGETTAQPIKTRFGYHIVRLIQKEAGGQKDLSDARVQAQIRMVIFNRKDQSLKSAYSEVARNNADINNFLAQRTLEAASKTQ
jgi:peptidyl-prolyl cis-trans isomerase SurA